MEIKNLNIGDIINITYNGKNKKAFSTEKAKIIKITETIIYFEDLFFKCNCSRVISDFDKNFSILKIIL
jgi:hypothetical protein